MDGNLTGDKIQVMTRDVIINPLKTVKRLENRESGPVTGSQTGLKIQVTRENILSILAVDQHFGFQ